MQLSELFSPADLIVPFDPVDKWSAIRELVQHLADSGRLDPGRVEDVLDAVLSRERSMSTGMEHGVAMPHAAVDHIETVAVAMGIVSRAEGLTFDSVDGRPARIVVLLVIPRAQRLLHIRTLADVARALAREDLREELLVATDPASAHATLARAES